MDLSRRLSLLGVLAAVMAAPACLPQAAPNRIAPAPPVEFLGEWGVRGDGPGQLSLPVSLAVDVDGLIYVLDAGSGFVHKFDRAGKPLLSFRDASIRLPRGLALDSGGGIYVTDFVGNRVFIFRPDGDRIRSFGGGRGSPMRGPSGVAIGADSGIYVAERSGSVIRKFNVRGRFQGSWSLSNNAKHEPSLQADLALGPGNTLYVANAGGLAVKMFSPGGANQSLHFEPCSEGTNGTSPPVYVGIASSDRFVALVDAASASVRVWSLDGSCRLNYSLPARAEEPGVTPAPVDVAWNQRGELLVLDQGRARMLRFRIHVR